MGSGGNLPVGPGLWGFIAFFVLALALWFLMRNMNGRMRRMAYRERERLEQAAHDRPDGHGGDSADSVDFIDSVDSIDDGPVPGDREADAR